MLADTQGHPLQYSVIYASIGLDSPEPDQVHSGGRQSKRAFCTDAQGIPYMIRSGLMVDERGNRYYLAIGRAVDYNDKVLRDFTWNYFALVPIVILLSGLLGWFLAGKALGPVNSVAEAAQRITHSNLDLQIPLRQTGDELDRLIEAFNHMMTRLNRSFEQIRQFSTDVSHELRTPLTVARGQLEVALFTAQTVEQHREAMADALEGIDRLVEYRAGAAAALAIGIRPVGCCRKAAWTSPTWCATRWISTRSRPKRKACSCRRNCRRAA